MKTTKTQPTLNLLPLARAVAFEGRRSVENTGNLAQVLLVSDAKIQKVFRSASDRKQQRRKLTTLTLKLSRLSRDGKNNLSSQMSQIFKVADARPGIRRSWIAGRYSKPYTINVAKTLKGPQTKSRRRRIEPQQLAYRFVRKQGFNLFALEKHIAQLQQLAVRVRANVSRRLWKRTVKFATDAGGIVLA